MKAVLWPGIGSDVIAARLRELRGVDLTLAGDPAALAAEIPDAEILIVGGHHFSAELAKILHQGARRLRFIQCYTAGYEGLQEHGVPPGVEVANASEAWAPGVAEHALALLLALTKRLPDYVVSQARQAWERSPSERMGTLDGATVVVVGFGHIGREFARRAHGLGMRVIGVSRSGRADPAADEVHKSDSLHSVLARADALLLALPYSPATRHRIGAAELAACKRGALLVNVSRGGVLDSRALADALRSGRLGGAGLDVTDPEPLPPGDPLWDAPNLIVTPHVAGACGAVLHQRLAEVVSANVARFSAGQRPAHVVAL